MRTVSREIYDGLRKDYERVCDDLGACERLVEALEVEVGRLRSGIKKVIKGVSVDESLR